MRHGEAALCAPTWYLVTGLVTSSPIVMAVVSFLPSRVWFYCTCILKVTQLIVFSVIQTMAAESDWHKEKQLALRKEVQSTPGLKVKSYRDLDTVCAQVKQVCHL